MYALALDQPYASAIVTYSRVSIIKGWKTNFRGRIGICLKEKLLGTAELVDVIQLTQAVAKELWLTDEEMQQYLHHNGAATWWV